MLQNPPEEYKGKYVACVPSEEPNPVDEISDKDNPQLNEDESCDKDET